MNISLLTSTSLFFQVAAEDIAPMLQCLNANLKTISKGTVIFRAGEPAKSMGLVLSGSVNIENDDIWGNKTILSNIGPGQVFAETYACIPGKPLMVSAVAAAETQVLFLDAARLLQTCPSACPHHSKLILNLLRICAEKNLNLSRRIFHTTAKTIRGRLLSYLSDQAAQQGSLSFTIPFNRQQLADYLGVDRSALSNELGKMQREGLLTSQRNLFTLTEDCRFF